MEWSLVGLAAVITAMVGVFKFLDEKSAKKNGEMLQEMDKKLDAMDSRIEKGQEEDRLAITRLEMLALINHDPDNVIEIKRMAKYYFSPPLEGNSYMTSIMSKYCEEHKIDPDEMMLKEK